ncbi:hypothetical protein M409DRAFT_17600 [Zasmidium cellare ATCC 36951]|uniref:Uncharacterized protein n=1 Tax=Zasmidium cellare ATCC 36951 TaxID=1080233 RepID=A0A6A6CZA3_ZASCE|nr:uncharacterized protein M409DRAFT_17600 [Zasmidium cellare ATCC 36951]KAF2172365.1 hypothetical protein M409DRAFT_17600 [Zasmidium cellare ATCC 36951]
MASPNRFYACETRVVTGLGCLSQLASELQHYKLTNPALVVDSGIANAGLLEKWLPPEITNLPAKILAPMNPDLESVRKGIEVAKKAHCDGVVIVGGGSSICLGKAVAICLVNPGDILEYEGNEKMVNLPVPTICVPTTAGSGSEVSRVLVLHEHGRPTEVIVRAMGAEPRVALLDGNVLLSCPKKPMLDAALDAITHACESLWSRRRTLITDALAEKALETLINRLPAALNDRDPDACQDLMEASSAANLACGNTGLALIHALTMSPDVPLPHGYQNGCLLLAVAKFNRSLMDPRHQTLVDQLEPLFKKIGWPGLYSTNEIDDHNAFLMVRASTGNPFRSNNIRASSDQECYEILRTSGASISAAA